MRKLLSGVVALGLAASMSGCMYLGTETNLAEVADQAKMINVTTGDGTFENYKATGHYTGLEFGIAIGIPGLYKFMELYPMQSNEGLLEQVASRASADGANAMINVNPHQGSYLGIPFGFIGLYVDRASGTGIKVK